MKVLLSIKNQCLKKFDETGTLSGRTYEKNTTSGRF